jgi:hypothetical protein
VITDIVFHLNQSGNEVTGDYEITPVSVERLSETYAPVFAGMGQSLKGTVSSTTVILDAGGIVYGGRGPIEEWTFTFTTDLMSGGVRNMDTVSYQGFDSDPKAFTLTRSR